MSNLENMPKPVEMEPGKPRDNRPGTEPIPEQKPKHPMPTVELPWWKKHGLKRSVGAALSTVGGTLVFAGSHLWGAVVLGVGAFIGAVGIVHGAIKKETGEDQSDNIWKALTAWLVATYNLIKAIRTNKKKGR